MPDIERLKKEQPEFFDYANIPDIDVDKKHLDALRKLAPQWLKDSLAKSVIVEE